LRNVKLKYQGFLLVAVPLLFELFFVSTLVILALKLQAEISTVIESRKVLTLISQTEKNLFALIECQTHLGTSDNAYNQLQLKRNRAELNASAPELIKAISKRYSPETAKEFSDLIDLFEERAKALRTSVSSRGLISFFSGTNSEYENFVVVVRQITQSLGQLSVNENQFVVRASLQENQARTYFVQAIVIGLASNVAVAILMAYLFSTQTVKAINQLKVNTELFAMGKPLPQPLNDKTELGELDRAIHRMAALVEESSQRERDMIEKAVDVICSIDKKGRILTMSSASTNAWLINAEELIGAQITTLTERKDLTKIADENFTWETELTRADDSKIHTTWSVRRDRTNGVLFCVVRDTTLMKQAQELKQQFSSMISHDLRTPLASLSNLIDMTLTGVYGPVSDKLSDRLAKSQRNLARLIALINELLEIESFESGAMELTLAAVPVKSIFDQAVSSVDSFASKNQIALQSMPGNFMVNGDEKRLIQVLVNLLSNSIKFSAEGTTIKLEAVALPKLIQIRVEDQGVGIPQDKLPFVFERFNSASDNQISKLKSTGLGLYICKSIIELHGGQIGVVSEVDVGTTIWMNLPRAVES
jgi:signal transduction histidine kinase